MSQTNTSIWEDSLLANCDVAIVGAGFLGLWTAYHLKLKNPKLNIHVYERDSFGLGASTRNAGFSCFGTVGEFAADVKTSSFDKALDCVLDRYHGLQEILKFSTSHNINIDYENTGGFELFKQHEFEVVYPSVTLLNQALEQHLSIKKTYCANHINNNLLPFNSKSFTHCISNMGEGGVNSAKLLYGLRQINEQLGVKIFYGTMVKNIQNNVLELSSSLRLFEIKASTIILAMNAFVNQFINTNIEPARGQILWSDNLDLKFKGTFHFDEGFYYFRTIGDGQLLIGGARNQDIGQENTLNFDNNEKIQNHLTSFVQNELNIKDFYPKKKWQGIMGFSPDKQPIIKEVSKNIWHLHACNGMGVALTPLISKRFSQQF